MKVCIGLLFASLAFGQVVGPIVVGGPPPAGGGGGMTSASGPPTGACSVGALQADRTAYIAYWCDGTTWQQFLSGDPTIAGAVIAQRGSTGTPMLGVQGVTSGEIHLVPSAVAGTGNVTVVAGGVTPVPDAGASHNFLTGISAVGAITRARPSCADLSDSGSGCSGASTGSMTVGTSFSLSAGQDGACTGTCAVSLPVPVAGDKHCIYDDDGVTTAITIDNPGSGTLFGRTDRSGYGTATVGTLVSTAGSNAGVCLEAKDSTHYTVTSSFGTWTNSGPVVYSGPGDIGTFRAWWGLRAYSTATRGNPVAQICNSGDANCATINSNATTGDFDVTTAQAAPLNCSNVSLCTVRQLFDQSGAGSCTSGSPGVACTMNQLTEANRMKLTFNCVGTKPCMTGNGIDENMAASAASLTASLPADAGVSYVAQRSDPAIAGAIGANNTGGFQAGFNSSSGSLFLFNGSAIAAAYTEGNVIAVGMKTISATATIWVNGALITTGDAGSAGFTAGQNYYLGSGGPSANFLKGNFMELGFSNSDLTTSFSALSANQRAYWGF